MIVGHAAMQAGRWGCSWASLVHFPRHVVSVYQRSISQPRERVVPLSADSPHVSVLVDSIVEFFEPVVLKVYVDCTLGAGGHALAVAQQHEDMEVLVGVDRDPVALEIATARLAAALRPPLEVCTISGNFRDLKSLLTNTPRGNLMGRVDAMVLDLGVSSMQLDTAERGFSFVKDGPLDMRMTPGGDLTAEQIVNDWSEVELGRLLRTYGEEKSWKAVARRIVTSREVEPILTTQQLVSVVGRTQLQGSRGRQQDRGKDIHPATRTFQALRIAVNDELRSLEQVLPDAINSLAPGGRLAVISFHSLEDRLVKHAMLKASGRPTPEDEERMTGPDKLQYLDELERQAQGRMLTRKPVTPSKEEMQSNPRSRSAKLRVFEKS